MRKSKVRKSRRGKSNMGKSNKIRLYKNKRSKVRSKIKNSKNNKKRYKKSNKRNKRTRKMRGGSGQNLDHIVTKTRVFSGAEQKERYDDSRITEWIDGMKDKAKNRWDLILKAAKQNKLTGDLIYSEQRSIEIQVMGHKWDDSVGTVLYKIAFYIPGFKYDNEEYAPHVGNVDKRWSDCMDFSEKLTAYCHDKVKYEGHHLSPPKLKRKWSRIDRDEYVKMTKSAEVLRRKNELNTYFQEMKNLKLVWQNIRFFFSFFDLSTGVTIISLGGD